MEWPFLVALFSLGLLIGSFLNVVIHRVPRGMSLVRPGSACPACGVPVRPLDNDPVLSYLFLRGRCRSCGNRISARYPLVELLTGVLFAVAAVTAPDIETAAFTAAAGSVLIALTFIDIDHRRVPNVIVLPATAVAIIWVTVVSAAQRDLSPLQPAFISAAAGFVLLLIIALVSGGMGMGDVKLAAFVGLVLGGLGLPYVAVAAFAGLVGGGVGALLAMSVLGYGRKQQIPFGPFLATGAVVAALAGQQISELYLSLLS